MCGIFFSCSRNDHKSPSNCLSKSLERRGPDCVCTLLRAVTSGSASSLGTSSNKSQHSYCLTFLSTVLSLRGESIVSQPLKDPDSDSLLCWNGEAWKVGSKVIDGNDGQVVFDLFLKAIYSSGPRLNNASSSYDQNTRDIIDVTASISGPYAFILYDALHHRIFYGRDALGRRSLVINARISGGLVISSVCEDLENGTWTEVEAGGVYMLDLQDATRSSNDDTVSITFSPQLLQNSESELCYSLVRSIP